MSNLHRMGIVALLGVGALLGTRGCGGVTDARVSARDQATKATCDRYNACGLIGTGQTYADYSTCQIAWESNWDSAWPAANCDGKISQSDLTVCLNRIASTSCTNVIDFLSTLGTCDKTNVCSAGSATDGG